MNYQQQTGNNNKKTRFLCKKLIRHKVDGLRL